MPRPTRSCGPTHFGGGGIAVTDNATPRIEGNRFQQYLGFAIKSWNAAPLILANDFDLASASGVLVEGSSLKGRPVIEDNRLNGNNRRTGFSIEGQAHLARNHVSNFTSGVHLRTTSSEVTLIDNTIEACDWGIWMSLRSDAYSREGKWTGPDASIRGMTFIDTRDEFRLGMGEASSVGPITLSRPARLNPIPDMSSRYGRADFMASEVHAWDEVEKLVGAFIRPNPARRVIGTWDSPTLGPALGLVASAAGGRWPYVVLFVGDHSCELVAMDNHRIAMQSLPIQTGGAGTYAIDLSACRVAAKLGDAGGQVTMSQDDKVLTISWDDQLVIAKRQEPALPDYERVMSPAPTDWVAVAPVDLRDALADALAEDTSGHGGVWIDASTESSVTLRWKAKGSEIRDRKIDVATVPAALRVGLNLRYLARMLDEWPAADLRLGVVAKDKPVHFRSATHPGLRYGIMPLRAESPDDE